LQNQDFKKGFCSQPVSNEPLQVLQMGLAFAPKAHTFGANSRHDAQAFGLSAKFISSCVPGAAISTPTARK
jgi:hypothetical protein